MRSPRNRNKHIDAATVEANIVEHMRAYGNDSRRPMLMSSLGYAGFKGYRFKMPQGAALAVSRIARSMLDRGVLGICRGGYYLRELG